MAPDDATTEPNGESVPADELSDDTLDGVAGGCLPGPQQPAG